MSSSQFLELAVSLSLQIAVVVLLTYGLARWIDERSRCRLWYACNLMILGLVAAALLLPHMRFAGAWRSFGQSTLADIASWQLRVGTTIAWIWEAGTLISFIQLISRSIQVHRFLRTCQTVPNELGSIHNCVGDLTTSATNGVRILSSEDVIVPFCWQFHHPYIVLPKELLSGDREQLGFIVKHELEHLRTGHPLQLFVQRILEVAFWFHPMVWLASQQSAVNREFVCDDAAIDSPSQVPSYLKTLLVIVERSANSDVPSASLSFGRGRHIVSQRADRLVKIAKRNVNPPRMRGPRALIVLTLAALMTSAVWFPVDVTAGIDTQISAWPRLSASVLHNFGISVRDFVPTESRVVLKACNTSTNSKIGD